MKNYIKNQDKMITNMLKNLKPRKEIENLGGREAHEFFSREQADKEFIEKYGKVLKLTEPH